MTQILCVADIVCVISIRAAIQILLGFNCLMIILSRTLFRGWFDVVVSDRVQGLHFKQTLYNRNLQAMRQVCLFRFYRICLACHAGNHPTSKAFYQRRHFATRHEQYFVISAYTSEGKYLMIYKSRILSSPDAAGWLGYEHFSMLATD